jgi:hypothetical protein
MLRPKVMELDPNEKLDEKQKKDQRRTIYYIEEGRMIDSANVLPELDIPGMRKGIGRSSTRNAGD